MKFDRYTLKKNARTEEAHLFHSHRSEKGCRIKQGSVCGLIDLEPEDVTIFLCSTKDEAKIKIASMGEEVCGNCAGHLHSDNVA